MDGNQHTQSTYSYDPVGNTRTTSGPYPLQTNNPIRYAAGYQTTTGLTKYGARYYDPNTGRFTQQDPSGQETNPYAYAGDNPIDNVDPTGFDLYSDTGNACIAGGLVGGLGAAATGNAEAAPVAASAGCIGAAATTLLVAGLNGLDDLLSDIF